MPASAQQPEQQVIEEIVVTGSYIRGTPQDAALPVTIQSREDLDDVGSPSVVEMVRNLGVSTGNIGETNQFNASGGQGNEGVATINLRGLGSERTLVLLNGRRHVASPTFGVDLNAIPTTAVRRVEILKDGAAALYGSDAVAGVVNFLTRDTFEGVELRASSKQFEGSDGNHQVSGIAGWANERANVVVAAEWDHRSEMRSLERGWATRPFAENPDGGYSTIGMPGTVFPVVPAAISPANPNGFVPSPDPECQTVGGTVADGSCLFQFTQFDNLVEQEDHFKGYAEMSYDVSDTVELYAEGLYARTEVPEWNTSPSYPPQSLFGPDREVPLDHPGVEDMQEKYPGLIPDSSAALFVINRMAGWGGFLGEPQEGERETDTYRLSSGLEGTLFDGELGFDVSVSWSRRDRLTVTPDMYVERMGFALDGLGGPDCDPATGTPGEGGCMWFTPFSNAVAQNAITGATNPNANPDLVAMNDALYPWLVDDLSTETENELLVFDATFDGQLPITLDGGPVGWAAGIQSRNEKFQSTPAAINDLTRNPCPFRDPASEALGHTTEVGTCDSPTGLFAFLSGSTPFDLERTIYGGFAELALPLTETLDAQLALRFEDYGGQVGSTLDPKLAVRWQATPALALRGSVSTTFRGPPQSFLEGRATSLQFVTPVNAFKAIDTVGNPNLDPESALASNFGVIVDRGGFYGSLDYWRFDFEDPFQVESFEGIIDAYSANDCGPDGAGAGTQVCQQLGSHIVFQEGQEGELGGIARMEVNVINGTDITNHGVDWLAQYDFDTNYGVLTVGTQGTHIIEYDVDDFFDVNGVFLTEGGDFAGLLNDHRNPLTPIVDLQGNVFAKLSSGRHRVTAVGRYWGEYEDDDPNAIDSLEQIDDMFTVDLTYNLSLLEDSLDVNLSVYNLFDEDPPQTQTDLNYDPYTHNPFGRMVKLGLIYRLPQ